MSIVDRIKEELCIEKVPEELWTCEQKAFVELAEELKKKTDQLRYDVGEIMEQLEEK